jgi:hypothetical protein
MMYAGMEIQFYTLLIPTAINVSFSLQIPLVYSCINILLYPVEDRMSDSETWPKAAGKATDL